MKVIAHMPDFWFLLEDGNRLFLSVRYQHEFADCVFELALTAEEAAAYRTEGTAYLHTLATAIAASDPCYRPGASPYKPRKLPASEARSTAAAREAWRDSQGTA